MSKYCYLLLLLLFSLLGPNLSAQDEDQMLHIQRNHYTSAEQLRNAVATYTQTENLYQKNGVTTPQRAYIFDDNTIEFVWEIDAMSDLDVIQDEYNNARMRIGAERVKELRANSPELKREFLVGFEDKELSYYPEGKDIPAGFLKIIRAEIQTDDWEELRAVAREAVTNAKAANHQTPFSFQMYPHGDDTRIFEVVEWGKDKADFERREADAKGYYNGSTFKNWAKKRNRVAKVLSVREGTYNEALSIPEPEKENKDWLMYVDEYQLTPGRMNDYIDFWNGYRELAKKYHWDNAEWFAGSDDGQTVLRFSSIKDFGDVKRLSSKGARMFFVPEEDTKRVNLSATRIVTGSREYVLRGHADLSYRPADYNPSPDENNVFILTEYSYPYGKGREVQQLAKDIKAHYEANKASDRYAVFTYEVGGQNGRLIVVRFAADDEEMKRRSAATERAIAGPETDALNERREQLLRIERRFSGTTRNDLRYDPTESSK